MKTKYGQGAGTRQKILEAAARVFGQSGYWNAAMEDIAASAGVAKGTLYLHFPGKEALFLAVVERTLEELSARMLEDVSRLPLRERLRSKIRTYLSFFEERAACFHAVTQEHSGLTRQFAEMFWKNFMEKCGRIEEEIRKEIAAGRIRNIQPSDLLFLMVGMMHGAIHQWFLSGRNYCLADKADEIADIVYCGIRSEP